MTEELKEIGLNIGHRRVGRLMRQNGNISDQNPQTQGDDGQQP